MVQEAVVTIQDIFGMYPIKYEPIIAIPRENLNMLDEPEARTSKIWFIGERTKRIHNANNLVESFARGSNTQTTWWSCSWTT